MEGADEVEARMLEESYEELINELLDDHSPYVLVSTQAAEGGGGGGAAKAHEAVPTSKLVVSSAYSGPTIRDIENALGNSQIIMPLIEKRAEEGKNKNTTTTTKRCENGIASDGYKWRKYGQKTIKNRPNPRSYYRCTNPRCKAKKQVERSTDDPDTYLVTYEGIHLHYVSYPISPSSELTIPSL